MRKQKIKDKLEELPSDVQKEVLDYIDYLLQKHKKYTSTKKFKFDWEGGLSELKEKYTSVELQHKAMEWW